MCIRDSYNPMGGCLPLLIQMPILLALWQVIQKPLRYMLGISIGDIDKLANALNLSNSNVYVQIEIIGKFFKGEISGVENILSGDMINTITTLSSSFSNFLGFNLGSVPKDFSSNYLLLLIPFLAAGTTYISSKLSMAYSTQTTENPMQNSMLFIGPLMTLFFSFSFPAGMGLYWIVGGIFQIFQQLFINKLIAKKKEVQNA